MKPIESILLVDDDLDDKYFFSMALDEVNERITLFTASDGKEALEKLQFIRPDVILLDMVMPGMNGASFLKAIKRDRTLSDIPVIIYTTSLSIFDESEMLKLGAYHVYIKPVSLPDTIAIIKEIVEPHEVKTSA
jgi:CheY-like chemotaxis protein